MRFVLFVLTIIVNLAGAAWAETAIPERRVILFRDMDFPGGDIQSIFDSSMQACENACLARSDCGAFTFNSRSNACFLKSGPAEGETYGGAFSAEVIDTPAKRLVTADERAAQLDFLYAYDLQAATELARQLPHDYVVGGFEADFLSDYAREAEGNADLTTAMRYMGATTVKTDAAADWIDFARLSIANARLTEGYSDKRKLFQQGLDAAVAGYLRANRAPQQVNALVQMAQALEGLDRGRTMIPALRLAQQVGPRDDTASELERAIGLYGFRVMETQVDSDAANPRICATFSESLAPSGVDYAPFVQADVTGLAVDAKDNQLCLEGVEHGERYAVTLRAGLPSEAGETLAKPVQLNLYVRDRSPSVHFPGRAYVLPAAADAGLPIVSVNAAELEISISRLSDRNVIRSLQENYFGNTVDIWDEDYFDQQIAEPIWNGTAEVATELNRDVTTRLPIGEALAGQGPGLYVLRATIPGLDPYDNPPATQWFVVSDIGVSTMLGADGLHVFARALGTAQPIEGASVQLLSSANAVLGETATDAVGYAHFAAGLTAGQGAAAPALVVLRNGDDMAFLSLGEPEFDLSDRGVAGHPAAPPIDLFLTTDRGAYRAGEEIHATVLARDGEAGAIDGLPLTAVLTRPDGVEYSRLLSADAPAGGHVFDLPLAGNAPRGTWRLDIHADPDAPALASTTLLVEDFLPERIDFALSLPEGPLRLTDRPVLSLDARYLFGAPGADLSVTGGLRVSRAEGLEGYPGYRFGAYDEEVQTTWGNLPSVQTDTAGHAMLPVSFPEVTARGVPLDVRFDVQVSEGSGRPVERSLSAALAPAGPMIGIRPGFDGELPQGAEARFDLLALGSDLAPMPMEVSWEINRVETRYTWYQVDGYWNWEPVTTRARVASGEASLGTEPVSVTAPTDWGRYEIVVTRKGGDYVMSSVDFWAGWFAAADASTTPDMLEVSLDAQAYAPGETATLRFVPRSAGKALVTVVSNRLIDMVAVDAVAGENTVTLPVTDEWGAGAYVTATLIQPLDGLEGHNPTRALGLAYASVDPGTHQLVASIDAPDEAAPRGPLSVAVTVDGIAEGETAFVTLTAVDLGILNLTSFASPDPSDHYFGQRRLGMGLRDLYGRLIDGRSGAMGQIRSGGDAMAQMRMQAPPPTEKLVAQFVGPVQVVNGEARATFDLPEFNGTVRLMAVAWSPSGVGQASRDVLVRDPVVLIASLPRFMAPGDTGRLLLELTHAKGPAGEVTISATSDGLSLATSEAKLTLAEHGTARLAIPVTTGAAGVQTIALTLTTPDGTELSKTLTLPVESLDPEVAHTTRLSLAPGADFTLTPDLFAGLTSPRATITAGPLARIDTAGLIDRLDRYPYGCTEQQTSRALPLLYMGGLAEAMGLSDRDDLPGRIGKAITAVLANQSASGSFGLWAPDSGDLWLDSYVSDFLSRARAQGYAVPDTAFRSAMDNLRNRVNAYPDFEDGGRDLAYALYVLAREGAAAMGDLRYYADVKAGAFTAPLAAAQLGAALAAYGDPGRADRMFREASAMLESTGDDGQFWRADYGTDLRDAAAVLTLAVEAGSEAVDRDALLARIGAADGPLSTQEATWSLLAANALLGEAPGAGLSLDGAALAGPVLALAGPEALSVPRVLSNTGATETLLTVTTMGVPDVPEPPSGNGYGIERRYFTLEGEPADPASVAQGTRLVTLVTVTPWSYSSGRLMVTDPLPAGFEIDNPNLIRAGDIAALDWLQVTTETENAEFREDRFLAAVDWSSDKPLRLAYIVRAVTPGVFHHPAPSVEDMYRPSYRAVGAADTVTVTE